MGPCKHYLSFALALSCIVGARPARAQSVQFTPNPFTFVPQAVGSPVASSKHLSITNSGIQPLVITSATITGDDFSFSAGGNTLDIGTISPGATFSAVLLFRATATGLRNGTLVLQDNAPNSPQILNISSQGFSGAAIQAPDQDDGIALATATVGNGVSFAETITSSGNQNVAVTGVGINGPGFSQTNNCGLTLS